MSYTDSIPPIKVIIVKGCLGCPYMEIRNIGGDKGGDVWCSDKEFIGTMKDLCSPGFVNSVYEDCTLTDLSEFGTDIENFVRYCYAK